MEKLILSIEKMETSKTSTQCFSRAKDVAIKLKHTFAVVLTCSDVISDIANSGSMIQRGLAGECWRYKDFYWGGTYLPFYEVSGALMVLAVFVPGVIMALTLRDVKWWQRLEHACLFTVKLMYTGLRSIELPFLANARAEEFRQRFLEMKRFENSFEATFQVLLNTELVLNMCQTPWTVYATLCLSVCSLMAGLFEQATNSALHQDRVDIRAAGKVLSVSTITATLMAIVVVFGGLSGYFNNFSAAFEREPLGFYFEVCCLPRLVIGLGCTANEVRYMLRKGRQRNPHTHRRLSFKNSLRHIFLPTFVQLSSPLTYANIIALKIFPMIVYVVLQILIIVHGNLIKFYIVILATSVANDLALILLHTLFLVRSSSFFVIKPSDNNDSLPGGPNADDAPPPTKDDLSYKVETFTNKEKGVSYKLEVFKNKRKGISYSLESLKKENGISYVQETFNDENEGIAYNCETYSEEENGNTEEISTLLECQDFAFRKQDGSKQETHLKTERVLSTLDIKEQRKKTENHALKNIEEGENQKTSQERKNSIENNVKSIEVAVVIHGDSKEEEHEVDIADITYL